ncbi:MAG: endonuclease [Xanthomonadales bacterium]|nr:endonuclease [Xanthomonadales bacterium]
MKFAVIVSRVLGCLLCLLPLAALASTPVFINELHYDNAGTDNNEAIEIAGPVGTNLNGWSLVLYNGSSGDSYDTLALSGAIPANCQGMGDGVIAVYPSAMQNGGADGVALVDASGQVRQFLSYEGSLVAANGPAAGLTSTDIGVSETNATASGQSLQLGGSGSAYEDFTWSGPVGASMGSCNSGQSFGSAAPPEVFVNEVHYDNAGADSNEGVEIAGPAGTSLSGWSLVLYNGSNGQSYATTSLSGSIPGNCAGTAEGVVVAAPGAIQNGGPDGLALVDASAQVVQFLSYEGSFTATNGPAAGMTSTDIGVAETNNTASADSLQLSGSGSAYADFTWGGPSAASLGACNAGQQFSAGGGGGAGDTAPTVVSTDPVDGSGAVVSASNIAISFSEPVTLATAWYSLVCDTSGSHNNASQSGSGADYSLNPNTDFTALEACTLTINASKVHDQDATADAMAANVVVHFSIAGSSGGDYYAGVDTSNGPTLAAWLHTRLITAPAPYTQIKAYPYSSSSQTDTWEILSQADEDPNNPSNILDLYKNASYPYLGGGQQAYNREHTWPQSLGFPEDSENGKPNPPHNDTHMLFLADHTYNGQRGNGLLGDCTASSCSALWTDANDGFGGDHNQHGDANWKDGDTLFEVWDHRKGDVARAVMYMAVRYNGGVDADGVCEPDLKLTDNASLVQVMDAQNAPNCAGPSNVAYNGLLSDLLQWNQQDPPDAAERLRNDVVFSYQHNRNPFVDHPEWATCVFKNTGCP